MEILECPFSDSTLHSNLPFPPALLAPHSLEHYLICSSYVSASQPALSPSPPLSFIPITYSAPVAHTAVTRKIHLNWNMG